MYNESIRTGIVPMDWRDAIVTPLFKNGNRSEIGNYRPISLTCIVCKVLESMMKIKNVEHLENNKLIKISQHGFMKGRSCLTNLLDFFEEVYDELDTNNQVDLMYLDFAKAFDKVPHKRLIRKMQACGIQGSVLQWIIKWLKNRRQRVRIRGKDSERINVTSGVPPGSVLGPLLFVIYINDIDEGIVSKISKFVDDTKLCARVNNEEDANALRGDLDKLHKWSKDWNMPFNMDKCAVMHVGRRNCRFEYEMDNRRIRQTEEEKDLGVVIHDSAKPSRQCTEAAAKANKVLGMIRRTVVSRDKNIILNLYNSVFSSVYSIQLKQHMKDKDKHRTSKNKSTKLCESHIVKTLHEVKWMKLTTIQSIISILRGYTELNHGEKKSTKGLI